MHEKQVIIRAIRINLCYNDIDLRLRSYMNNVFLAGTKVVVFTQWQAIYYGVLETDYSGAEDVYLLNSRHGYALDTTHGAWQVCSDGPGKDAKVGPGIPRHLIRKVASIAIPAPAAIEAWDKSFWL